MLVIDVFKTRVFMLTCFVTMLANTSARRDPATISVDQPSSFYNFGSSLRCLKITQGFEMAISSYIAHKIPTSISPQTKRRSLSLIHI